MVIFEKVSRARDPVKKKAKKNGGPWGEKTREHHGFRPTPGCMEGGYWRTWINPIEMRNRDRERD